MVKKKSKKRKTQVSKTEKLRREKQRLGNGDEKVAALPASTDSSFDAKKLIDDILKKHGA
jgi:hypothetical protein